MIIKVVFTKPLNPRQLFASLLPYVRESDPRRSSPRGVSCTRSRKGLAGWDSTHWYLVTVYIITDLTCTVGRSLASLI